MEPERLDEFTNKLKEKKKAIIEGKPKPSHLKILKPSDQSDWKMIKYFDQMKGDVKESFGKHLFKLDEITTLDHTGPTGEKCDNLLGHTWHKLMKFCLDRKQGETSSNHSKKEYEDAGISLLDKLYEEMKISVICRDFPLYGYMYNKKELSPEIYFWRGSADTVGMFYNQERKKHEYVIIDWKVKKSLLGFWTDAETFGMHLHQGLSYAKLLQLHLELDYLPSFLLVPISGDNGRDVHPGLFFDYPDECKEKINNQFLWAIEPLAADAIQQMYAEESLLQHDVLKELKKLNFDRSSSTFGAEKPLKDVFDENATVGDLLKAMNSDAKSLTIIPREKSEDN